MSNPYAPPSTPEEHPGTHSNKDTLLRRIGALALFANSVKTAWLDITDPDRGLFVVEVLNAAVGFAFILFVIYGFLRFGKNFHLIFGLAFSLAVITQVYFRLHAIRNADPVPQPITGHPWLDLALHIAGPAIACVCGIALYFRATHATSSAG